MNQLQELRSTDPVRRLQAIAQSARSDSNQTLPILRQIQQSDPLPNLRDLATEAIQRIEQQKITSIDFMATIDKRQKSPAMPSPFAEEIIQLSPAKAPRPATPKRKFTDTLSSRPKRQYSDDPEQYEGGTRRNLLPLVLVVVLLLIVALSVFLLLPK